MILGEGGEGGLDGCLVSASVNVNHLGQSEGLGKSLNCPYFGGFPEAKQCIFTAGG